MTLGACDGQGRYLSSGWSGGGGPPTDGADLGERATSPLGALLAAAEVDGQWVTLLSGRCPCCTCGLGSMARGGGKNATDPAGSKTKQKPPAPLLHSSCVLLIVGTGEQDENMSGANGEFSLFGAQINMRGASIVVGALTHSPHQQQKQHLSTATCYVVLRP